MFYYCSEILVSVRVRGENVVLVLPRKAKGIFGREVPFDNSPLFFFRQGVPNVLGNGGFREIKHRLLRRRD